MRKLSYVLFTLLLAIGATACGGDGGNEEASTSTTKKPTTKKPTTTTTSTTGVPTLAPEDVDAGASPYCGTWAEIQKLGEDNLAVSTPDQVREHYGKFVPVAQQLVTQAPPEVKGAAETALRIVSEVVESGSQDPFSRPESEEAGKALAQYALSNCAKG